MTSENVPTLNDPREKITAGFKVPDQRHTVDTITPAALTDLYNDLARHEEIEGEMNETAIDQARDLARAPAAVARVRALHQQYTFGTDPQDYCAHCNQLTGGWIPWPCPTVNALNGEPS